MQNTRNKPNDQSDETKVVRRVAPLEMYVVDFVDGAGQASTRVMARVGTSGSFYFPFPDGMEKNMKTVASWLSLAINNALGSATAMPAHNNDTLPAGSPMGSGKEE